MTRKSIIAKPIAKLILKCLGWKAVPMHHDINKSVVIMAPHTSTWDIVIGMCTLLSTDLQLNWVGKKELFKGPLGSMFRAWGGVPLDRAGTKNLVEAMASTIKKAETFHYGIAPEGTRSYAKNWRSGFYHIAMQAKVPMVFYFMDFKKKIAGCGPLFRPTGNIKEDMEVIREFYSTISPRNPEKCGDILLQAELE